MSAPESPTFTKRNAMRASVEATRRSDASAMQAPAPAVVPFREAMTGLRRRLMLRTIAHVAARAERAPLARHDDRAHLPLVFERRERVRQLAVDLERQRVQPLRPVEPHP